ncbi:hypothetical protein BGZ75_007555 [Mortierella antarctica]|nr:hypothetical protein BGZ75_007555 [Mortierella antarctica]
MNEPPSQQVLSIPEILGLIINCLDAPTLLTASLVCSAWHIHTSQVLWRQLIIPKDWFTHDLTPLWPVLDRRGHLIRALSLDLSTSSRMNPEVDMGLITAQLDNILSRTPSLERLIMHLPRETKSSIVSTIAKHCVHLKQFETDIFDWNAEDMSALLRACPELRQISGHDFTGKVLEAIATSQPRLNRIACTHPRFDDDELVAFAKHFPDLLQLSVSLHQFLTERALVGVATHCLKLEILNFHFCLGLASTGFRTILQVSSNLRFLDLGLTEVRDSEIQLVATQCPELKSLRLPFCSYITHESISAIVRSSRRLEYLDISWCDQVQLLIFNDDAPWVCHELRHLDISGIHANYTAEAHTPSALLPMMYRQMSFLPKLEYLKMSGHGFSLRLLEVGRPFLSSLTRLQKLDISKIRYPMEWKDIVEVGNLFPSLKEFQFRTSDVIPPPTIGPSDEGDVDHPLADEIPNFHEEHIRQGSIVLTLPSTAQTDTTGAAGGIRKESPEAAVKTLKASGRGRARSSTTLQDAAEDDATKEDANRSSNVGPSKRRRIQVSSSSSSGAVQLSSVPSTSRIVSDTQSETMDEIVNAPVLNVYKATLRSGLEISVRIWGEDETSHGGDGWPFQGGILF